MKIANALSKLRQLIFYGMSVVYLSASAQSQYPNKPIKLLVGFPSASSADVSARILSKALGEALNTQIIVENKPGASSNIATEIAMKSAPDGYTLFLSSVANTINAGMGKTGNVNFVTDLMPIALITSLPNILVINPNLKVNNLNELLTLLRSKPGAINFASSGNGTAPHLSGEMLNMMAGVKMVHIPYKGSSQAITDVLSGLVPIMFAPASTALPHINNGSLKALAVTSLQRSAIAPQIATMNELGLNGFETSVWFGLMTPVGTKKETIDLLNKVVNNILKDGTVKSLFLSQGIDPLGGSPDDFAIYIKNEISKWERLIKYSGATFD
jgi:tripartite-type tricarboxylate transporter receptor subunit TctC